MKINDHLGCFIRQYRAPILHKHFKSDAIKSGFYFFQVNSVWFFKKPANIWTVRPTIDRMTTGRPRDFNADKALSTKQL